MKNLILVIVFVLAIQTTVFSQDKFTADDLIGYWEPDRHATQLVFWKDTFKNLQMVEFSTVDGALLTLLSMKLIDEKLVVKTISKEKNWKTESTYTFIDKNTLKCEVKGPVNAVVTYTKFK
jgi:hypothetical protein